MATKPKMIPAFQSEEEELRFWDEHNPWEYIAGPADIIIDLKRCPEKKAGPTPPDEKRPIKV